MLKNIILKIDKILFKKRLHNFYLKEIVERKILAYKSNIFNYGFSFSYAKKENSLINKLCDRYGTDKGETKQDNHPYEWVSHNYADFYEILFRCRRKDVQLLIECGLGTNNINLESCMGINGKPGASLRMWRDFFPKARVIGVDVDREILFKEERIDTYCCDQLNAISIENFAKEAKLIESSADIIIDDGLHTFEAGLSFFEGMIKFLGEDGIYIIEDVTPKDMNLYKNYFIRLTNKYSVNFIHGHRPNNVFAADNRLVIIQKQ